METNKYLKARSWFVLSFFLGQALMLLSILACEGDSGNKKKGERAAASPDPVPAESGGKGSTPTQKVVFEDPAKLPPKMTIKAYHMLVKEGPKDFSGYCIALSKDPKLGSEAGDTIVVKQGGCPTSLTIKGKPSPMAFVCNPVELSKEVTQQVVLYSQLETGGSYKDIKTLNHEIILGFCTNPQAT